MKPSIAKLWAYLKIAVFILFIVLFVKYFLDNRVEFTKITLVSPIVLLAILVLQAGIVMTNVFFFKTLLTFFNININLVDSYKVIVQSSLINFFGFLQGGTGYRAYYAKKKFNISYKKFTFLFAANTLIVFLITTAIGLAGVLLYSVQTGVFNPVVILVFLTLFLTLALTLMVKPTSFLLKSRRLQTVQKVIVQWRAMTSNKKLISTLLCLSVLQFTFSILIYGIELWSIGGSPSFTGLLVYTAIANLSILVAITPSAIGIRESLLIFGQNSLGVSTGAIILSATIDRVSYFILLIMLAVSVQVILFSIKNRKEN